MSVSVSETIGKLLLEGYKMLADSCDVCCTVLMQDRRGRIICVQCESTSMANATQDSMNMNAGLNSSSKLANGLSSSNQEHATNQRNAVTTDVPINSSANRTLSSFPSNTEDVIVKEIQSATSTLQLLSQQQHDIQSRSVYVKYIRECAETLISLKALKCD